MCVVKARRKKFFRLCRNTFRMMRKVVDKKRRASRLLGSVSCSRFQQHMKEAYGDLYREFVGDGSMYQGRWHKFICAELKIAYFNYTPKELGTRPILSQFVSPTELRCCWEKEKPEDVLRADAEWSDELHEEYLTAPVLLRLTVTNGRFDCEWCKTAIAMLGLPTEPRRDRDLWFGGEAQKDRRAVCLVRQARLLGGVVANHLSHCRSRTPYSTVSRAQLAKHIRCALETCHPRGNPGLPDAVREQWTPLRSAGAGEGCRETVKRWRRRECWGGLRHVEETTPTPRSVTRTMTDSPPFVVMAAAAKRVRPPPPYPGTPQALQAVQEGDGVAGTPGKWGGDCARGVVSCPHCRVTPAFPWFRS